MQPSAGGMAQASADKLDHLGPAGEESLTLAPNTEQLARTSGPAFPKRKRTEPSVEITKL